MKQKYDLGFISDENIYTHVAETVELYSTGLDLKSFNKNIVDPIKLTFDSKIYGKTIKEIITAECVRQMDKSNNNHIGYFHQNLFKYAGNGWEVPNEGFDVINNDKHLFIEMKNKHNTMNSASSQKTYMKMQDKILHDGQATCMLVEVIAKKSQNEVWNIKLDKEQYSNDRIRRVSIDKFYDIVFEGYSQTFCKLCKKLPDILDDVVKEKSKTMSTVFDELNNFSPDIFKSLYLLAFKTYDGFDQF